MELIHLNLTTMKVFSVEKMHLNQDIVCFHVVMSHAHVAIQSIIRKKVSRGSLWILIPVPCINFSMDIQDISIVQPYVFQVIFACIKRIEISMASL